MNLVKRIIRTLSIWRKETTNHRKKHITSLKNEDGSILRNAKQILAKEESCTGPQVIPARK